MAVINLIQELKPISTAKYAIISFLSLIIICIIVQIIYNIYFHPLSSFPGPKLHAATDIPFLRGLLSGKLSFQTLELHKKYGGVVRIAPNELSYDSAQGWRDIYGHRVGKPQMEKSRHFYDGMQGEAPNILSAVNGDHPRFRRVLSHAFSEKALREQEILIKVYIDLLIQRLKETSAKPTDMTKWYNWVTFDIFGDLCFGESFHCVEKASHHPWVSTLFDSMKLVCLTMAMNRHPRLKIISKFFAPRHLQEQAKAHNQLSAEKVAKRREIQTDRADFMTYILKNQDKSHMADAEINSNAAILIIAGSETTGTVISGVTYRLLKNPEALKKLVEIIRETFASEDQITMESVSNIAYLSAILEESMLCGEWIPGNTTVSVNQWAAFRSAENFTDPDTFIPERFMGDPRFASDNFQAFQTIFHRTKKLRRSTSRIRRNAPHNDPHPLEL
ncbi:hypothetical protein DID88_005040 [Monilinia fructigena]|uniref:Cytochrome P450 n=1 Tax=Monilinia fructigena TaxID=38457 RepID=A0A395IRJ8_9HELO|nr:hypothetical protein DID88_005040 [Monilinia fructigena]